MIVKKTAILFLSIALCLCACQSVPENSGSAAQSEAAPTSITVTDLIGREVTITPASIRRVVCIGAGALRMFCYIADPALLCGVEDIDNTSLDNRPKMFDGVARPYLIAYGDCFTQLPTCGVGGPNAQTAEAEKILSCNPDIVISAYEDVEKANALQQQLGVPVLTVGTGRDGVFDRAFCASMQLLGTVFGKEERAKQLIDFVEEERAQISRRTQGVDKADKPVVYLGGLGNWGTTNHLMTSSADVSLQIANINNISDSMSIAGVHAIEKEMFVMFGEEADLMIFDAAAVKNIIPAYREDPVLFEETKAWKTGQVFLQMAYNAYYTNFEIALMNAWFVAKTAYPECFSDIDLTEKTNEITSMFLKKEMAAEIFAYPFSYGGYQNIDTAAFFAVEQ